MVVLWENHRKTIGKWWLCYGKIHHVFHGTINYKRAIFNSYVTNYQRVSWDLTGYNLSQLA